MNYLKQNIELILTIISFVTIILIYIFCKSFEPNLFLGLIGTTATLYFGTLKYKIENDKIFKELFYSFNKKYDERFNDLLNKLKNKPNVINEPEGNDQSNDKTLIIDYLNLCAEEYLWRSKGRIPNIVWYAWKAGIKENLKIKQVKEVYESEISTENGKKSYYGLVEELKIK